MAFTFSFRKFPLRYVSRRKLGCVRCSPAGNESSNAYFNDFSATKMASSRHRRWKPATELTSPWAGFVSAAGSRSEVSSSGGDPVLCRVFHACRDLHQVLSKSGMHFSAAILAELCMSLCLIRSTYLNKFGHVRDNAIHFLTSSNHYTFITDFHDKLIKPDLGRHVQRVW